MPFAGAFVIHRVKLLYAFIIVSKKRIAARYYVIFDLDLDINFLKIVKEFNIN